MKLTHFSIQNYRNITKAELKNLQLATVLIGPNNEGKSNILHALNACLTLLSSERAVRVGDKLRVPYSRERSYDWQRDFPITKQSTGAGESKFQLHFELTTTERANFYTATKSKLNDVLPIELRFGPQPYATFKVLKQGKGGSTLSKKSDLICAFIRATLGFAYIPAVRNAGASLEVISTLVNRELEALEANSEYTQARKALEALQTPILEKLSATLTKRLQEFLGSGLKGVTLSLSDRYRSYGRSCQLVVDDGAPTLLERKGDGVQSLVAISLMIDALQHKGTKKDIILLIEEPESHLHPKAIHRLGEVLDALKQDSQLIISTHCPLLVNRANVGTNLIVSQNKATAASSLGELRTVLGVKASDNLQHAALVIVVEGEDDEIALKAILENRSATLRDAFKRGATTIMPIHGASKLSYSLASLQMSLCNYHAVLDDDAEGRKAYEECETSGLVSPANTTFTKCPGMAESEFEDLLSHDVYADYFKDRYGVDVRFAPFNETAKWSERIGRGMAKSGKSSGSGSAWPGSKKQEDKKEIAQLVAKNPTNAIHPSRLSVVDSLVSSIEERLKALSTT